MFQIVQIVEGDYYLKKESVEEYIRMAEGVNGADLIEKMSTQVYPGSKVLEIGSGPGTDWDLLNEHFNVVGSDYSQEFLTRLIENRPNGRFLHLDAMELKVDEKFDAIYSNKVLHHLTDEEFVKSIERQVEILNPRGIICHSFWKGEGSEIFKGLFVNYHDESKLRRYFEKHFQIISIEAYAEFEDADSLLLIGRKK